MGFSVKMTYYDTAMVLIEIGSLRFLTDPVFDDAGTAYEAGVVRLEKTLGGRATPSALGRVDAVLLSHDQHPDNLDMGGRAFLKTAPLVLSTPLAASRLDTLRAIGLEPWQSTQIAGEDGLEVTVTAVPAQHGPDGTQEATGPVTGFLLKWDGQEHGPLYVSGDTVPFRGTEEIAERCAPVGLALLNLGHVEIEALKGAFLSLSAAEAITYAEALQARAIVPIHFEGWRHFTQTQPEARAIFASSPIADRVQWLEPGESESFHI